ncbi:probable RNA-directed DNA polymerase from transposon X-element [Trichonephila clavipes]|nr:probable RNA-directed DNA polymerase from transposon X-element [Trichonephila clavipes]
METDANPSDTDYVTDDVKDIIRQYHPVCVALQETFLKSCHTTKIRRYGCLRKDTEGPSVSGGVCIFTSLDVPSSALPFHTSLQAVAVRIHSTSLITVCCLYLPPNTAIHQHDLNNLINQLPAPFIILGDFNGHSTLWEPYNSDHFPVILSHDSDPAGKTFPPTYSYRRADWALFTQLAVITDAMVKTESIDTAVQEVTNVLIAAADLSIPKSSSHSFKHYKPWWNADCQTAYKNQRRLWGIFRRYPTTENLLAFKRQKQMLAEVWKEHCFPSSWREAIVIPILKPGKVATDPLSYRPIALTSCFCKTFERMVNTRLVYVLEKEKCISPLQSGFRKGRSTHDNLVFLESQIRDAFVRRNHLVSLFFDIEKAYDRTWRYGILRNMYDFGLRGNLPIFIFNFLAVRYFNVRIGHSSSHKFIQDQGVPQGSVLSVTLFNIHMSNILHQLPPSVRGMLYVDDLQVSCQGSDMRLIERQLQTTVNRLVQWCDQNGHTISPSKSSCVHFCRNVLSNTLWGADRVSLLRVYQALILSRLDYGCVVYGSARASVLKRLDTVYHSALRICSGAFKTSPVTSLYVVCHQPPLELRRRQLCANYFIRAMSVPSHPLKPFALAIGLNRLYEARSFNIKPFSERAKAVLNDAHLNHINIQENNIFAFPPWDIQIFNYHNPFSGYDKADTAAVIYQQLFYFHRNRYSKYIPVYTDGSKTAAHVGCGVIFNNTILSFSLHHSMSVFSAELTAILVALQHIIVSNHRHFCVYTDSMSALESLHFSTEHRHPTVIEILLLLRKLERKGFDVIFSWVPGHVGILGNEQADTAARSMSDHMQRPVCYRDLKTSTQNYIHRVWQETWDQQVLNKLHSIHPSTSHWAALPVRRHDVRLTRLRIGHTRFTHRHLLLVRKRPPISIAQSDHTSRIRCDAFSARDLDIQKQSAAASQPALDVCRGSACCIVTHASFWKKLCVGDQKNIHINGHSSRREYGSNICDSRNYDTEECCRGYNLSLYPLPEIIKEQENTHQGIGGAIPHLKKKRGRTSLKNSMTWETMSWTFTPRKATKV